MSTYSLKVKCKDSQVEVIAKSGNVISKELDIYLNEFIYGNYTPQVKSEASQSIEPQTFDNFELAKPQENEVEVEGELVNSEETLKDFIEKVDILDTFSKFIATAYYFKNKLNSPSFTLKSLNAEFYPATGVFCDISLMENAKSRGFIDQWEDEEGTKYSINTNGESFFTNEVCG